MKVYIETYGCALNKGDSYIMMTLLKDRGHDIVGSYNQADVIVLNTCAVRLETEERMKQRIKELKKIGKKLIIAGCLVSSQPALVMSLAPESSIVGAQSIDKIVEAVESNKREIFLEESKELITPRIFEGKISIIPIADGCAGDCNFCITKLARKKLRSYPPRNIVNAVKEAIQKGAVEIELTAQDTAAYGLDINYNLVELLKEILEIEGNYMIRIGMMTPELAIKQIDKILEIMKDKRVYKFLHLPVQSGDNKVLKLMNRKYTVDEYRELVKEIRNKIPLVNITTDIIIGHPGEDEEAFLNTINLIKEIKFERIHLAMYSIRPNTRSASMPQVPDPIKKERMKIANEVYEEVAYSVHSEYLGSNALVLTTELGRKGSIIGRTINYIPVVVKDYDKLGDWINVKITEASFFDLRGKFIQ
ncbi:tRNA (N(6)-L-threonylcarbamoyladenosine(37)-C(2))-methylthiotransferase [Sulfolobus sp. S-194]|nr:tRNA (N(6)-L-threonylcarbamoyladenosine(37)-C(2))-methylthiotransferase [Sulfolobus sp. S-194]